MATMTDRLHGEEIEQVETIVFIGTLTLLSAGLLVPAGSAASVPGIACTGAARDRVLKPEVFLTACLVCAPLTIVVPTASPAAPSPSTKSSTHESLRKHGREA